MMRCISLSIKTEPIGCPGILLTKNDVITNWIATFDMTELSQLRRLTLCRQKLENIYILRSMLVTTFYRPKEWSWGQVTVVPPPESQTRMVSSCCTTVSCSAIH